MEKFEDLIQSPMPVLVDFFVKIDVDQHEDLATKYRIQAVPTFILFKNGEAVWRHSGVIHSSELQGVIERHYT